MNQPKQNIVVFDTKIVTDLIGKGFKLWIPFDSSLPCKLLAPRYSKLDEWNIYSEVASYVISNLNLEIMSKESINNKLGWEELRLPGDTGNLYRFIQ